MRSQVLQTDSQLSKKRPQFRQRAAQTTKTLAQVIPIQARTRKTETVEVGDGGQETPVAALL